MPPGDLKGFTHVNSGIAVYLNTFLFQIAISTVSIPGQVGSIKEQDSWMEKSRGKQANQQLVKPCSGKSAVSQTETLGKHEKLAHLPTSITCEIDIRTRQYSAAT